MPLHQILNLLKNSGFHIRGVDTTTIWLEDPSCIMRSLTDFIHYAWIAIYVITGVLLFGWAVSMIRGAKNNIFINIRNLTIVFGTLAGVGAIVNSVFGEDLFAKGCREIGVPLAEVQRALADYKLKTRGADDLYEEFNIYDSASGQEYDQGVSEVSSDMDAQTPGGDVMLPPERAMVPGPGNPEQLNGIEVK